MSSALIGYTGFVGTNLRRQNRFDALFNSQNIDEICGQSFELLVCGGMPAAKWIANKDPDADLANMNRLLANLKQVSVERLVLISTIDVYPRPVDVDEATPIDLRGHHAYGRHRCMLESAVRDHFGSVTIVRLPALFGPGLKKNAVYDLLNGHQIENIHCDAIFQWYNVDRLWADIQRALTANLPLVNFATEPVSVAEMARVAFGIEFDNRPDQQPARYDFRSKHDRVFGGQDGYLYLRRQILMEMRDYVDRERQLSGEARDI
jgi:nucleoside-diphosphate-sugar epimerase